VVQAAASAGFVPLSLAESLVVMVLRRPVCPFRQGQTKKPQPEARERSLQTAALLRKALHWTRDVIATTTPFAICYSSFVPDRAKLQLSRNFKRLSTGWTGRDQRRNAFAADRHRNTCGFCVQRKI
jgi:hypothetical protein